jgi:hypothetical protein
MDIISVGVPILLGAVASSSTYLIHKVIEADATVQAHIAEDKAVFESISTNFIDIKTAQRDQTQKLDRLIEHMLPQK